MNRLASALSVALVLSFAAGTYAPARAAPGITAPAAGAGSVNRSSGLSSAHHRWCENRWRSYRASDNSYQPSYGPRRSCISPHG